VSEDFAILHPSARDRMPLMWPRLYGQLLERLRQQKVKDKHLLTMMEVVRVDIENPKSSGWIIVLDL
jgi:hypothetical protein